MTPLNLILYTTSHCHLCDRAEQLLARLSDTQNIVLVNVEISESDELLENYGTTIPVLKRTDNNAEIKWPFTIVDLEIFINQ